MLEYSSAMEEAAVGQNKESEELKSKCQEYLSGWQRTKADFLNYEKEEARRFSEVIKFANEGLLKELILILDSFALAVRSGDEKAAIIQGQLEAVLRAHGLEKLPVKSGEPFNPKRHEAIAAAEDGEAGTILEVIDSGYTLNGKIIRPAKIKISNKQI